MHRPITNPSAVLTHNLVCSLTPSATALRSPLLRSGSMVAHKISPVTDRASLLSTRLVAGLLFTKYGMKNTGQLVGSVALHATLRRSFCSSTIKSILDASGYVRPKTADKKPGQIGEDDEPCVINLDPQRGYVMVDNQSLIRSLELGKPTVIITDITMDVSYERAENPRELVLSKFGSLLLLHTRYGYAYHKRSRRLIAGEAITYCLRKGAKLTIANLMTDNQYLYHPQSKRYVTKSNAGPRMVKGEIFTTPHDTYWLLD